MFLLKTMTNYLQKSRRREQFPYAFIAGIFCATVLLIAFVFPTFFGSIAHTVSRPLWSGWAIIRDSGFGKYFSSKQTLILENQKLRDENEILKTETAVLALVKSENAELKSTWGRDTQKVQTLVGAVLVTPPRSPYDTMVIDVGSKNGVKAGALVSSHSHVVLGVVQTVYDDTSIVELFSSPESRHEVILGQGVRAQAVGKGAGVYEVSLPRGTRVNIGDPVYIPSITPRVYGVIDYISEEEARPFITVMFKTPVNVERLTYVEVDINGRLLQTVEEIQTQKALLTATTTHAR